MRLAFGACEFDDGRRLLLRHGSIRPLSPKAFQLLELLIDRRPEAVAKAELLERLWPDSFVTDASLHNLVAEIRAAIGDTPSMARYIRTIPRYGYAFHGEAHVVNATAARGPLLHHPWLVAGQQEWPLAEGSNLVGRARDCAIRVESATLSRHHARIIVTSGEATVEDLGSKNGSRVNGRPIVERVTLHDHDQLQFGAVTMTYRVPEALTSTVTRHT